MEVVQEQLQILCLLVNPPGEENLFQVEEVTAAVPPAHSTSHQKMDENANAL